MHFISTFSKTAAVTVGFGILLFTGSRAQADSIVQWNKTICDFSAALPKPGLPPFLESRAYAMAHLAMFDALHSVSSPPYSTNPNRTADPDAAVAAAARAVLVSELPMGTATFNAAYATAIGAIPDSGARALGIEIGEAAAAVIIAQRASDDPFGRLTTPYTPGSGPGAYQPTPPLNIVLGAGWTKVPTFVLKSNDQFRAPIPYSSLRSLEYTMDVNEIQALGKGPTAAGRTPDQTAIAMFWYENSSFAWNRIAQTLSAAHGLSRAVNARLFAALNCALADAYLASFDSKYYYNFWRPITAIRAGSTDDNPLTVEDATWSPLLNTPPIPDYPSGHSAAGGAASVVIAAFVGDENTFVCTSTTWGATRTVNRVSDAATENAFSRMLVGIHFRRACTVGLEQGRAVGKYVLGRPDFLKE
jgi:hypothetical protein